MEKAVLILAITIVFMACVIAYLVCDRLCYKFFKQRETEETLKRVNGLLCVISQELGICDLKDPEKTPRFCRLIPMLPKELRRCEKLSTQEKAAPQKAQPK